MKMNEPTEFALPDVKALVAFGKLGMGIIASRMLSLLALLGVIAVSFDAVYSNSWIGASLAAVIAIFVFIPALKAESKASAQKEV